MCPSRTMSSLADLGVAPGDRVATLLWNQTEHLELYFAVPAMGATLHTLNPRLHPDELAFIANDAGDSVLVVDESLWDVASSIVKPTPSTMSSLSRRARRFLTERLPTNPASPQQNQWFGRRSTSVAPR